MTCGAPQEGDLCPSEYTAQPQAESKTLESAKAKLYHTKLCSLEQMTPLLWASVSPFKKRSLCLLSCRANLDRRRPAQGIAHSHGPMACSEGEQAQGTPGLGGAGQGSLTDSHQRGDGGAFDSTKSHN